MADDDPFADLGKTLQDEPDDQMETETSQESMDSTTPDFTESEGTDHDMEGHEDPDPRTDAAFTYEAAHQRPFYAREETIEDFDSWVNYELERDLSNRGYQNIVVREMTDALLRMVVEEDLVDEVAGRFEEAREDAISK